MGPHRGQRLGPLYFGARALELESLIEIAPPHGDLGLGAWRLPVLGLRPYFKGSPLAVSQAGPPQG